MLRFRLMVKRGPVHVKTIRSQKLRMLLTHRKLLQSKAIAIENDLRGTLRNFGLKVGMVGKVKFEARIKELVENLPDLAVLVEPMLIVRRTLREQIVILHRRLLAIVRDDNGLSASLFLECSSFSSWATWRHRRQAQCAARRMHQMCAHGPLSAAQADRQVRPSRQYDELEGTAQRRLSAPRRA